MIDTILVELMLFPVRVRLAVKQLLVKRLERIAVLHQHSQVSDTKLAMPAIHSRVLESLKSSIVQDKELIAGRKGEPAPQPEIPETSDKKSQSISSNSYQGAQPPASIKPRTTRNKQKSRRKSYIK